MPNTTYPRSLLNDLLDIKTIISPLEKENPRCLSEAREAIDDLHVKLENMIFQTVDEG